LCLCFFCACATSQWLKSGWPLRVLHQRVAEDVENAHVRVLDPAVVGVVDHESLVGNVRHAPALRADQRRGFQTMLLRQASAFTQFGELPLTLTAMARSPARP